MPSTTEAQPGLAFLDAFKLTQTGQNSFEPRRVEFDANEVIPGLWLGSLLAEQSSLEDFRKRNITHVVRCGVSYIPVEHHGDLQYLKLDVIDLPSSDLLSLCQKQDTNAFIAQGLKAGGVLVHCQAGVSRSTTVTAAYLMCTRQIGCKDALEIIKAARSCICPNPGFHAQLRNLENECKLDVTKYKGMSKPFEQFSPAERVARGEEWLAKRQGVHVPPPPPVGLWKPNKSRSIMPPPEVLASD